MRGGKDPSLRTDSMDRSEHDTGTSIQSKAKQSKTKQKPPRARTLLITRISMVWVESSIRIEKSTHAARKVPCARVAVHRRFLMIVIGSPRRSIASSPSPSLWNCAFLFHPMPLGGNVRGKKGSRRGPCGNGKRDDGETEVEWDPSGISIVSTVLSSRLRFICWIYD